jgi:outer membrane protein
VPTLSRRIRRLALIGLGLAALPAAAQTRPEPSQEGWRVSVGAAVLAGKEWTGSSEDRLLVVPDLDVRYGDRFFASFGTGIGVNLLQSDGFRAGALVRPNFGREEEDDQAGLRGMGDIDFAAEPGVFAEVTTGPLQAGVELRQALGGHEGLLAEARVDYRLRLGQVGISFGPRVRYGDDTHTQAFYGVSPAQAVRAGLPSYRPEGGIQTIGLGAGAAWRVSPAWTLVAFGEAGTLQGDAKDSPLVRLRGQDDYQTFGFALSTRLRPRS